MKTLALPILSAALTALTALAGLGCAHSVRIESTPGAVILVNGKNIGSSPATFQETTGMAETVQVTARHLGREKTIHVSKGDVDIAPIGAGAGIGAAACGAGLGVTVIAAFVFLPCAIVTGAASWASLAAAPAAGWFFFGHKLPDTVRVDLGDAPAVADVTRPAGESAVAPY